MGRTDRYAVLASPLPDRGRPHCLAPASPPGAADNYAADIESDQRRNTWFDPTRGRTTVAEWVTTWFAALDLNPRTIDNYRSVLRCHILLRWAPHRSTPSPHSA